MENRAYTKNQVALGTFFGGPFAAIYMLKKNFDVMGDMTQSQKTIKFGLMLTFAFVLIVPFLPEFIPSVVYGVAYTLGAQSFYVQNQASLKDNPRFSNWNVTGLAVISLIAIFIVILLVIGFYDISGIMPLEIVPE
ncbi:MAG TPA: hypothetical protein DCM27_01910 [Rhodospirillaceae bacterium]|nr:hypothetical protein [Rhodospirillaceae bacterium]